MKSFTKYIFVLLTAISATWLTSGCKKLFDTTPKNILLKDSALQTGSDFRELLNGSYDVTANLYNGRVQVFNELLSDNVGAPKANNDFREIYNRATIFFNSTVGSFYGDCYRIIYRSNSLLDNIDAISSIPDADKKQMKGEARFLRALGHFTLVRLFAQPYGYTADNSHLGIVVKKSTAFEALQRNTCKETYDFIVDDLNQAITALPETNANGVYATKYAAKALLAKVYFQMNRFSDVIANVNDIANSGKYALSDSVNRFDNSANSHKEFLFYIKSSNNDQRSSGLRGNFFIGGTEKPEVSVSKELYTDVTSRSGDKRAKYFTAFSVGTSSEFYKTSKFDSAFFDIPVLHYTDMLLMRAEALAETNTNLTVAINDLNAILTRAFGNVSQNLITTAGPSAILNAARLERRIEMPMEGDRVQQLKRIGAKGEPNIRIRLAPWNCNGLALQFPASESTIKGFQMNPEGGCN